MSAGEGDWYLVIEFPRPYTGVEVKIRDDGCLEISLPFDNERSAVFARDEMSVSMRPQHRVVPGEVVKGEIER